LSATSHRCRLPWAPRTQDVLVKGNYVTKITAIENATSSGNYPLLRISLECPEGVQWDNLVISPADFSVAKLKGLIVAAKVAPPSAENGEINAQDGRLSDGYIGKLIGRQVGTIVRDEEDNRPDKRGQFRPRVQGYVPPEAITNPGAMASSPATQQAPANGGATQTAASGLSF
jgi:hypothetical protein